MDEHERIVIDGPAKIYFSELLDKGETSHLLVEPGGDVCWVQDDNAEYKHMDEIQFSPGKFAIIGKGIIEL